MAAPLPLESLCRGALMPRLNEYHEPYADRHDPRYSGTGRGGYGGRDSRFRDVMEAPEADLDEMEGDAGTAMRSPLRDGARGHGQNRDDPLMRQRKGTVHFAGVNAFKNSVHKNNEIRLQEAARRSELHDKKSQDSARSRIHEAMLGRRSQYTHQYVSHSGAVRVQMYVTVLYCLAWVGPSGMVAMVTAHALMFLSARGFKLEFMLFAIVAVRSLDIFLDNFIGLTSDRLPTGESTVLRRRAMIFIGACLSSVSFAFLWRVPRSLVVLEDGSGSYDEDTADRLRHLYFFSMYAVFHVGVSLVLVPLEALGVEFLDGYDEMEEGIRSGERFLLPSEKAKRGDTEGRSRVRLCSLVGAARALGCAIAMASPLQMGFAQRDTPPARRVATEAEVPESLFRPVELYCKCSFPALYNLTGKTHGSDATCNPGAAPSPNQFYACSVKPYQQTKWYPDDPYARNLTAGDQVLFSDPDIRRMLNSDIEAANKVKAKELDLYHSFMSGTTKRPIYSLFKPETCHQIRLGKDPFLQQNVRLVDPATQVADNRTVPESDCRSVRSQGACDAINHCEWFEKAGGRSPCLLRPLEVTVHKWCALKHECERTCEMVSEDKGFQNFAAIFAIFNACSLILMIFLVYENQTSIQMSSSQVAGNTVRNRKVKTSSYVERPGFGGLFEGIMHVRRNWKIVRPWLWGIFYDYFTMMCFLVLLPFYVEYTVRPAEAAPFCDDGRRCPGLGVLSSSDQCEASEQKEVWCSSMPWAMLSYVTFFTGQFVSSLLVHILVSCGGVGQFGFYSIGFLWETTEQSLNGKQVVFRRYSAVVIVCSGIFALCAHTSPEVCVALSALVGISHGPILMHSVVLADVVDCDEFKTGQRAEARYTALMWQVQKAATCFAILVPFSLMYILGFKKPPQGRYIDGVVVRSNAIQNGTLDFHVSGQIFGVDSEDVLFAARLFSWAMKDWIRFMIGLIPAIGALYALRAKDQFPIFMSEQMWHMHVGNALHLQGEAAVDPLTHRIHVLQIVEEDTEEYFKFLSTVSLPDLELMQMDGGDKILRKIMRSREFNWALLTTIFVIASIVFSAITFNDRSSVWVALFCVYISGPSAFMFCFAVKQKGACKVLAAAADASRRSSGRNEEYAASSSTPNVRDIIDQYVMNSRGLDAEHMLNEKNRVNAVLDCIVKHFVLTEKRGVGDDEDDTYQEEREQNLYKRFRRALRRADDESLERLELTTMDLMPMSETLQGVVTANGVYQKRMRHLQAVDVGVTEAGSDSDDEIETTDIREMRKRAKDTKHGKRMMV